MTTLEISLTIKSACPPRHVDWLLQSESRLTAKRMYTNKGNQLRYRSSMAHTRQSRPDSGLGSQVKVFDNFEVVPSSLGSVKVFDYHIGWAEIDRGGARIPEVVVTTLVSCELTATTKPTQPSISRGRVTNAEGCNARDAGRSGVRISCGSRMPGRW